MHTSANSGVSDLLISAKRIAEKESNRFLVYLIEMALMESIVSRPEPNLTQAIAPKVRHALRPALR